MDGVYTLYLFYCFFTEISCYVCGKNTPMLNSPVTSTGGDDLDSVVLGFFLGCVGEEEGSSARLSSHVWWEDWAGGQQTTRHVFFFFFFFFCGGPEPELNSTEHNAKPDPNNKTVRFI